MTSGGAATLADPAAARTVRRGERGFRVADHPSSADGIAAFLGGAEAATLGFFDAALPFCARAFDVGAYVGFMSLYAATQVAEVHAVEASPAHQALLRTNLALNPGLAARIELHPFALGAEDGQVELFAKGLADSGTSVFRTVERGGVLHGRAHATVPSRAAAPLLAGLGLDRASLLKIDVEGAEYAMLPHLAALLAARLPFLAISFHPFNLVDGDGYTTALRRLGAGAAAAAALASYPFVYLPQPRPDGLTWRRVEPAQRLDFLQDYVLAAKPAPRIATPQLGFLDTVCFSAVRLAALNAAT